MDGSFLARNLPQVLVIFDYVFKKGPEFCAVFFVFRLQKALSSKVFKNLVRSDNPAGFTHRPYEVDDLKINGVHGLFRGWSSSFLLLNGHHRSSLVSL